MDELSYALALYRGHSSLVQCNNDLVCRDKDDLSYTLALYKGHSSLV